MNPNLDDSHVSIRFYDSDYPAPDGPLAEINFDSIVAIQGLAHDIERFLELAGEKPLDVLDLCTGTGRIAIPLARAGHRVAGVDISQAMLDGFARRLNTESEETAARVRLVQGDISALNLGTDRFDFACIGFNSLMCIPDFEGQLKALVAAARHLKSGALFAIDLMNPLILNVTGDAQPKPFFTRRNPNTGKMYTRFAMAGAFDEQQRQELSGWYDEYEDDGSVKRHFYSMYWKPIYRYELELMLGKAEFDVVSIEGGHRKEAFTSDSRKMFVIARRR